VVVADADDNDDVEGVGVSHCFVDVARYSCIPGAIVSRTRTVYGPCCKMVFSSVLKLNNPLLVQGFKCIIIIESLAKGCSAGERGSIYSCTYQSSYPMDLIQ
jgi:hypothetical protein